MWEDERFAVKRHRGELHECLFPNINAAVTYFYTHGYIATESQEIIDEQPRIQRPTLLIEFLLPVDGAWTGLHQFLCSNQYEELSKKLHVAKENFTNYETPKSVDKFRSRIRKPWNAPLKMKCFVGRELLLQELTKLLGRVPNVSASAPTHPTREVTCVGLGGVGKSSLALEFAYRNLNIYSNIFWISAVSKKMIETQFIMLAEELRLSAAGEKRSWEDTFSWLHSNPNSLIIFDDAPDYGSIKEYIPRTNGNVLITSRNSLWPHQVLKVDAFTDKEALSCINTFLPTADKIAATLLAHELENCPLALAQACAYVVQRHVSIEVYLQKLRRSQAGMLTINIFPNDCIPKPVHAMWNITLEQIGKECEFSIILLEFCSLLEGHSIPDSLLQEFAKTRSQSTEVYEKSRSLLYKYVLLTEQNVLVPCVSVHPLVQAITTAKLTADQIYELYMDAYACIHQLWPDDYNKEYGKWCSALMPQLLRCLEHIQLDCQQPLQAKVTVQHITNNNTKKLIKKIMQKDAQLINASAIYAGIAYRFFGDYHNAIQRLENALYIAQKLYDVQHTEVATSLNELGVAYDYHKNLKKAKHLHEKALKIRQTQYGPDHIEVATSLNNLGSTCHYLGDYKNAKELFEKALKIRQAHYGPDHMEVAATLNRLGSTCENLGDYKNAKDLHEKALKIIEAHYGPDHIEVATSLNNLGLALHDLGDYNNAKERYEKALKITEAHYGPDHIEVASSLNNLGSVYHDLRDFKNTKELYEKALKIREAYYGCDHLQIAISLNKLGSTCEKLGDYTNAKELHEKALKIREAHYGSDHIQIATSLNKLGSACEKLGDYKNAKALYEKALKIEEEHYGPEYIEVASSLSNLGSTCEKLGDYENAKLLYEKALKITAAHYGSDHVETAALLKELGSVYHKIRDHKNAKELLEKALKIRKAHYGTEHILVATTLNNLGLALHDLGDYKNAKKVYKKALEITTAHYGPDLIEAALKIEEGHGDLHVATTLSNLGSACHAIGDYMNAKKLFERELKMREAHCGSDHIQVATSLNNLGLACHYLGEYSKAKELYKKALRINEKKYGPDHIEVAILLNNLGLAYEKLGDYKNAKELYEKALRINEKKYGPDHIEVAILLNNLGLAYEKLGDYKNAKELCEKAQKIREAHYGPDPNSVLRRRDRSTSFFGRSFKKLQERAKGAQKGANMSNEALRR